MEPIIKLEGETLAYFLDFMRQITAQDSEGVTPVYSLRFAINDGGLKVKVNGRTWSVPMGREEA